MTYQIGQKVRVKALAWFMYPDQAEEKVWRCELRTPSEGRASRVAEWRGLYVTRLPHPVEGYVLGYTFRKIGERVVEGGGSTWDDPECRWFRPASTFKVWLVAYGTRWQTPMEVLPEHVEATE